MAEINKPKFYRLVNGGWGCMVGDVRFTFFKPYGAKGLWRWRVRAYWGDKKYEEVATTREGGIEQLMEDVEFDRRKRVYA